MQSRNRGHHIPRMRRAAPAVCVVVASLMVALPLPGCSMASVGAIATPATAFLLARAGSDTVRVGPGAVQFIVAPGHSGPASNRDIYGLELDVEAIAGPARALLPRRTTRAIVVPWDYDAGCRPVPFAPSVRWVSAGVRGVFRAELRPRSGWIDGVPTLDLFTPGTEPYAPGLRPLVGMRRIASDSMLTPEEMLAVMDRLPEREAMHRDAAMAARGVYEWVRANPVRSRLFPAAEIARSLRFMERSATLATVRLATVGTYRVQMLVDGRAPLTLFARTTATPTGGEVMRRDLPSSPDPLVLPPFDAYSLLTFLAPTDGALPRDCSGRYGERPTAYMTIAASPPVERTDGLAYVVNTQLEAFARTFPGDSALHGIAQQAFRLYMERRKRNETGLVSGTIVVGADGSARLSQVETLADGRRVTLTGERVAPTTVTCVFDW